MTDSLRCSRRRRLWLVAALWLASPAAANTWALPAEGDCAARVEGDATPIAFVPGDFVTHDRALVLEVDAAGRHIRQYVDLETLFPFFHVDGGAILQQAGRWSEDRPDCPRWPDDPARPMRVIDPVASILLIPASGEVVRAEARSTVAVPPPDRALRSLVSESSLARED